VGEGDSSSPEELVRRELDPGEVVLWSGAPSPETAFRSGLAYFVAGSVVLFGFSALLTYFLLSATHDLALLVFLVVAGVPATCTAVWWMGTPFRRRHRAGNSICVLTDRRAIVFDQERSMRVQSFDAGLLAEAEANAGRDGRGDILFPAHVFLPSRKTGQFNRRQAPAALARRGFRGIRDVEHVNALITQVSTRPAQGRAAPCEEVDLRAASLSRVGSDAIRNAIATGEKVLWTGTPAASPVLIRWSPLMVLGGALAAVGIAVAFAPEIFAQSGVFLSNYPVVVRVFGVGFAIAAFGLGLLPVREYRRLRRTVYAVSNRNAYILEAGSSSAVVRTFSAGDVRDHYRRQRPDGSGDLVLQRRLRLEKAKRGAKGPGPEVQIAEEEVGFMGVQDVRGAERCIRALEHGASQGTQAPR